MGYLQNKRSSRESHANHALFFDTPVGDDFRPELVHHHHAAALSIQMHGPGVLSVGGFNQTFLCQCFQQGAAGDGKVLALVVALFTHQLVHLIRKEIHALGVIIANANAGLEFVGR